MLMPSSSSLRAPGVGCDFAPKWVCTWPMFEFCEALRHSDSLHIVLFLRHSTPDVWTPANVTCNTSKATCCPRCTSIPTKRETLHFCSHALGIGDTIARMLVPLACFSIIYIYLYIYTYSGSVKSMIGRLNVFEEFQQGL